MSMVRSPFQSSFRLVLEALDSRQRRIVLADLRAGDTARSSGLARRLGCSVCEVSSARESARRFLETTLGEPGHPLPWHQVLDALGVGVKLRDLTAGEAELEWRLAAGLEGTAAGWPCRAERLAAGGLR